VKTRGFAEVYENRLYYVIYIDTVALRSAIRCAAEVEVLEACCLTSSAELRSTFITTSRLRRISIEGSIETGTHLFITFAVSKEDECLQSPTFF
jgi:hypothetical protein